MFPRETRPHDAQQLLVYATNRNVNPTSRNSKQLHYYHYNNVLKIPSCADGKSHESLSVARSSNVSGGGGGGSGSTTSCLRGLRLRWGEWLFCLESLTGSWCIGFKLILLFSGLRLVLMLTGIWLVLLLTGLRLVMLILLRVVLLRFILFRSWMNLWLSGVSGIGVIIWNRHQCPAETGWLLVLSFFHTEFFFLNSL